MTANGATDHGRVSRLTTCGEDASTPKLARADMQIAVGLFVSLFLLYNANGREVGSSDSQPTKFAARELLLRHTFSLNQVVLETPAYKDRWGIIRAADGHYRSIYSPLPAVAAAAIAWPLWKAGVIDVRAPLAPSLIAKIAASLLVAAAVVLAFFSARQRLPPQRALLVAVGLGAGTGFWSTASQTLWQTETAVFGLALAILAFANPRGDLCQRDVLAIGIGLGIAGFTRPQLAPAIAVLLAGTWSRSPSRHALTATVIVALSVTSLCIINIRWFGNPLGALPLLQRLNSRIHVTGPSFRIGWEGLAGLLVSPSRGLLVFSPIVAVAAAGMPSTLAAGWKWPLRWCVLAMALQYVVYASYAVWWGGHTYGPRYMLDILPLAVPLAAAALRRARFGVAAKIATTGALGWSILVAGTGAFCYPHDAWNVDPVGVDRDHSRLWSITDNQIHRCWARGLSPQNFSLFDRAAVRRMTNETQVTR
jgi:hypothetical protein